MYKTLKDLDSITFPVYPLRSEDWYEQDGILFIDDGRVLDDRNVSGATLGIRRAKTPSKEKLYRIKRVYPDFPSMMTSKKRIFIDSKGEPFIYERVNHCPLKYHKVKRLEFRDTYSLIWIEGIPYPFRIPRPPYNDAGWVRVLYYKDSPWLIWDFQSSRSKNTFRRV
jgi:hypothetical protein